jgi:PAS domain S-box-containing protein
MKTKSTQMNTDITKQTLAEEALRQNEERFRRIVENAPFGYFRIGNDGLWQYVNPEWERMHECSLQELVGKGFELMQPEDLKTQICTIVYRAMAGETIKGELQRRLKDGYFLYYVYTIQPVYQDSKIVAVEGFTNDLTARKQIEDLVRDLSQKLLQTQERERQMISYELHDSIAQNLSCMKISLDTFFKGYSDISPELIKRMKEFSKLTEQTIIAVRDLSYDLRPPGLDELGLLDALRVYCNEFYEKSGVNVYFQPAGIHTLNMDIDTQIHLYRLIQEGLNNVRKHAGAGQVTIKLIGTPSNIILRIEDDGKGFDVKARERERLLNNEKRMGLRSMQERVNLLHGQMKIESSQMKGTCISIKIPNLEQDNEPKEKHINY